MIRQREISYDETLEKCARETGVRAQRFRLPTVDSSTRSFYGQKRESWHFERGIFPARLCARSFRSRCVERDSNGTFVEVQLHIGKFTVRERRVGPWSHPSHPHLLRARRSRPTHLALAGTPETRRATVAPSVAPPTFDARSLDITKYISFRPSAPSAPAVRARPPPHDPGQPRCSPPPPRARARARSPERLAQ